METLGESGVESIAFEAGSERETGALSFKNGNYVTGGMMVPRIIGRNGICKDAWCPSIIPEHPTSAVQ